MKYIDFKIKDLSEIFNAKIIGDNDLRITGINDIANAKEGDITFLSNIKYLKYLDTTKATAVIL